MTDKSKKAGVVTHYYTKIGVGIVKLDEDIKIGDQVRFKGKATDFTQPITEMQSEHQAVQNAKKGQEVGIKVEQKVREEDEVFLVE